MSEFVDNQAVTTEMLNNIAVDLGKPEFNVFGETKFGVEALNSITRDLTSKGILNTLNRCNLTFNNNVLTVDTGIIVFDNGAKLRIEDPVNINIISTPNTVYVYAVNDIVNNKIEIRAIEEELVTGDFLLLCKIENRNITDTRKFSRSKIEGIGVNKVLRIDIPKKDYASGEVINISNLLGDEYTLENFNFIIGYHNSASYYSFEHRYQGIFIYDIKERRPIFSIGTDSQYLDHVIIDRRDIEENSTFSTFAFLACNMFQENYHYQKIYEENWIRFHIDENNSFVGIILEDIDSSSLQDETYLIFC